jgi:FO synthase subunit 2
MNESISTSAGAAYGQFLHPVEIRARIRACGRLPVQRSTTYQTLQVFDTEATEGEAPWRGDRFGSYASLISASEFRFKDQTFNVIQESRAGRLE